MKRKLFILKSLAFTLFCAVALTYPIKDVVSGPVEQDNPIQTVYDPSGTWNYEIETPDQTLQNTLTISKNEEGEYVASLEADGFGTIELQDITFEKMVMEATAEVDGDSVEFEFKFDDDSMEGIVFVDGEEFTITAERESK